MKQRFIENGTVFRINKKTCCEQSKGCQDDGTDFCKKNQFFPFLFDVHRLPRYGFAIVYGEKMLIMTGNLFSLQVCMNMVRLLHKKIYE
jgi:hypothetical protein